MSLKDHYKVIFSTIFPENLEAFRYAQTILTEEHFSGAMFERTLWTTLLKYSSKYGGIPTVEFLTDTFQKAPSSRRGDFIVLEEMVSNYVKNSSSSLSAFKASVDEIHEEYIKVKTGNAIAESFEILEQGLTIDGEVLHGHADARDHLADKLTNIEAEYHVGEISEGDVISDNDFMEEYNKVKEVAASGESGGIGFGIASLDRHVGGVLPGDLVLVAAFTGAGKTQALCQMAWHAAVNQKKNVFFSTTETVRRQVHVRIVARHSRLPKFGLDRGLNSRDILKGLLSAREEKIMGDVLDDLRTGGYGSIFISQNPADATWDFVESRIKSWEQRIGEKSDLALIDSIYLLKPTKKRATTREELVDLLQDGKRRGTALNIPIVSPWQITRGAWEKAVEGTSAAGFGYTKAALSDTSEAEKSASIILTLLRDPMDDSIVHTQILKNRDGEELGDTMLNIDLRNAFFSDGTENQVREVIVPVPAQENTVESLVGGGLSF